MINLYSIYSKPHELSGFKNRHRASLFVAYNLLRNRDLVGKQKEEAEKIISTDTDFAYQYARSVLRDRFEQGEHAISKNPYLSFWYARYVLKRRWFEQEDNIKQDNHVWNRYCEFFRIPE